MCIAMFNYYDVVYDPNLDQNAIAYYFKIIVGRNLVTKQIMIKSHTRMGKISREVTHLSIYLSKSKEIPIKTVSAYWIYK